MLKFIKAYLWFSVISTAIFVVAVLALILWMSLRGPNASREFSREVDQDLVEAAALGDKAGVNAAIAAGADVNAIGIDGIRPLEWVNTYNCKDGFEYLLQQGADPNAFNDHGECAVHYTVQDQDADYLRMVLERGGDPNIRRQTEIFGFDVDDTALFSAVCRGNQDFMKVLVEYGADINVVSNDGSSPLIVAAGTGYGNVLNVKWLLEQGADWTVRDESGVGLAEAILHQDKYDAEKYPEQAAAYEWILDFLEEQGVDLAEAEERSREIYGPNFRRFSNGQ